jgi:hypothetical protein
MSFFIFIDVVGLINISTLAAHFFGSDFTSSFLDAFSVFESSCFIFFFDAFLDLLYTSSPSPSPSSSKSHSISFFLLLLTYLFLFIVF